MAFDFGNANDAQRSAISITDSPLLIRVELGTGKTYTPVKRIVYLITEKNVLPEEIMITTFTDIKCSGQENVDDWYEQVYSFIKQMKDIGVLTNYSNIMDGKVII